MTTYSAKILADSINEKGDRLTTFLITIPKFIQAELNTHRMLSRNSASSRAIPNSTLRQRVLDHPVIPVEWGENQRGMQAANVVGSKAAEEGLAIWLRGRDQAVEIARQLAECGIHKQVINRVLEPWMFTEVIVSATSWAQFFRLRCHRDAQPEFKLVAEMMRDEMNASTPTLKTFQQWHLPLIREDDLEQFQGEQLIQLSAARCARVSYLTHEGTRDPEADFALYKRLVDGGHLSPLEHQAKSWSGTIRGHNPDQGNFKGWVQARKLIPNENGLQSI